MGEAWIYGELTDGDDLIAGLARELAELGFAPRRVTANGSLRPSGEDGTATGRPPDLSLVLGDADVCTRLESDEDLGDVPIIRAVGSGELGMGTMLREGHELILLPAREGELRARIARARMRVEGIADDEIVRVGSLEVQLATYQVSIAGRPIDFTYMEYQLLKFLVTHPGRVFTREALLSRVWGYDYYGGARTVDVHVRRVRAKLGSEHSARIKTVRSVGYRFEGDSR